MHRWLLTLIGAALFAAPALLAQFGVKNLLGWTGGSHSTDGMSGWLSLSISAGAYLIEWGPLLVGALIIYYANRSRN